MFWKTYGLLAAWVLAVHWRSVWIWFDWESVRFFVQPRPGRFRVWSVWFGNYVDLSDYGIEVASSTFRPLMAWLFQGLSAMAGTYAPAYHLPGLILHCLCVCMLFRLGLRLELSRASAVLGALFFAVHPLVTQPMWILPDLAEVVVLAGGLTALLCYETRPRISLAGLLAACLAKETAVTIPLWLLSFDLLFVPATAGGVHRLTGLIRRQWPYWSLLAGYILYRQAALGGMGGYRSAKMFVMDHLLTIQLQNAAWLLGMPAAGAAAWILLAVLLGLMISPRTPPRFRWPIIWAALFLLPVANLCNKWYLYTPTAAAGLLFGAGMDKISRILRTPTTWRVPAAGMAVVTCMGILSVAELHFQTANSRVPGLIARQTQSLLPSLPKGAEILYLWDGPVPLDRLKGHWFNPATFQIKAVKPPEESIVWDLNATRFLPDGTPVWTRSVEAALRLYYNDITINVRLEDFGSPPSVVPQGSKTLVIRPEKGIRLLNYEGYTHPPPNR